MYPTLMVVIRLMMEGCVDRAMLVGVTHNRSRFFSHCAHTQKIFRWEQKIMDLFFTTHPSNQHSLWNPPLPPASPTISSFHASKLSATSWSSILDDWSRFVRHIRLSGVGLQCQSTRVFGSMETTEETTTLEPCTSTTTTSPSIRKFSSSFHGLQ